MRCAERRKLEAYALGQLDEIASADVRAHLATCGACAGEAGMLAAERRLFVNRAALPSLPAPPPFADVLARSREGGPAAVIGARRARMWSALAAAAALIGFYAADRGVIGPRIDEASTPAIVAEPSNGERCEDAIAATDRAVDCTQDEHAACLMATPAAPPVEEETCECGVTCEPEGPHHGEALESRAEGERAP